MPGQKISSMTPVSELKATDEFPLSRSGSTYKIAGDKFASMVRIDSLSAYADSKFALKTTVAGMSAYADSRFALKSYVDTNFALKTTVTGMSAYADSRFALKTTVTGMSAYADSKFISKPASATTSQVLTYNGSQWVASGPSVSTQNDNYTLALSDNNSVVQMENGSPRTLTVPTDTSVAFPIGSQVIVFQKGAGQVTISAAAGVTILSNGSKTKTAGLNSSAALIKLASNNWLLGGDIIT